MGSLQGPPKRLTSRSTKYVLWLSVGEVTRELYVLQACAVSILPLFTEFLLDDNFFSHGIYGSAIVYVSLN